MSIPTLENVARPRAMGYGVALGDRLFRLAVGPGRQLEIVTAPLEAPRVNTTSSPEEAAAEFGLTFARSQFDGGEGLFRAHVDGAAPNRFWSSRGVTVSVPEPGEFPQVSLLHEVAMTEEVTGTLSRMAFDVLSGALYVCDGVILRRTDNPEDETPSWVDDDPAAGETLVQVYDVAVLGDIVYVALGANGIHRKVAGVWSHYNAAPATRIWAIKNRILAVDGPNLRVILSSGGSPTSTTVLDSGFSETCAVDGGSHILVGADDGYVYAYSTETGSLVLAGQTHFENEQVEAIGSTQGVVAVGTRQGNIGRLYIGALDSNGLIVDQQLVRSWGGTGSPVAGWPHKILGTRAAFYIGLTNGTYAGLWRYDLVTGGLTQHLTVDGVNGQVYGIEVAEGRLHFSVDGAGVYTEQDTFVDEGWLIGPLGDFFTSQEKSWVGARLDTANIGEGETVELSYASYPAALADDTSSEWTSVVTRDSGEGDPGEVSIVAVVSRHLAGKITLTPSAGNLTSPAVFSFSFRAYPSSGDEDRIVSLPINVSDQIERRGRRRVRVKGRGETEYTALRALEGRPVVMRLFKPPLNIRGLVEEVATPVMAIPHRGSATMVSQVRIRGQVVGLSITSGPGPYATDIEYGTTLAYGESA